MYSFLDFETLQNLPDTVTILELSQAMGLSRSRTYQLPDERRIPYIRIQKRIIIFKKHLLQGLSQQRIFTEVAKLRAISNLPDVFPPNRLVEAFKISYGFAYTLSHYPGFPAVIERDRIIIDKRVFDLLDQKDITFLEASIYQQKIHVAAGRIKEYMDEDSSFHRHIMKKTVTKRF